MGFRAIAILILLLLANQRAFAATASGSSALALASLVAVHSPVLHTSETLLIRRLFNGHFHQLRADTKPISVEADAIACSIGNVDITPHSCKLTFGRKLKLTLHQQQRRWQGGRLARRQLILVGAIMSVIPQYCG